MTPPNGSTDGGTAAEWIPARPGLRSLRDAAAQCRACELWRRGTQTVFGEGPRSARIVLAGEQPGDREDREGRPFVGPAGRLLDRALADAGVDRGDVYLTNVVKHFNWEGRGKRRIHRKPSLAHVRACRPWLEAELAVLRPELLVCLGATAAQAVMGRGFRLTRHRGELLESELAPLVAATVHPSSILRASGEAARRDGYGAFVRDLETAMRGLATDGARNR